MCAFVCVGGNNWDEEMLQKYLDTNKKLRRGSEIELISLQNYAPCAYKGAFVYLHVLLYDKLTHSTHVEWCNSDIKNNNKGRDAQQEKKVKKKDRMIWMFV